MLRAQGYATLFDPDKGLKECDTFTCAHCNRIIHKPVNRHIEEVGDFCRSCMKVVCARCADKRVCTPLMKSIEMQEERNYRLRGYFT